MIINIVGMCNRYIEYVKFPKKSRTFFFSDFMKYSKAINRKSKPGVKRNILKFPKKEIKIKKQEIGSK